MTGWSNVNRVLLRGGRKNFCDAQTDLTNALNVVLKTLLTLESCSKPLPGRLRSHLLLADSLRHSLRKKVQELWLTVTQIVHENLYLAWKTMLKEVSASAETDIASSHAHRAAVQLVRGCGHEYHLTCQLVEQVDLTQKDAAEQVEKLIQNCDEWQVVDDRLCK